MIDDFFYPAAVGAFFGADCETVFKSFVLARDRHGPQCDQCLRIDLTRVLGQQIRLFDCQVRRKDHGHAA